MGYRSVSVDQSVTPTTLQHTSSHIPVSSVTDSSSLSTSPSSSTRLLKQTPTGPRVTWVHVCACSVTTAVRHKLGGLSHSFLNHVSRLHVVTECIMKILAIAKGFRTHNSGKLIQNQTHDTSKMLLAALACLVLCCVTRASHHIRHETPRLPFMTAGCCELQCFYCAYKVLCSSRKIMV